MTPDARRESRRRWPLIAAGLFIVLIALVSVWWFLWVPHWRPPLLDGERYGIDVSAHQNRIDWGRVAEDEIEFAYIKATEGGDFVDARFSENWAAADDAGLERGAYHFFTLCTSGSEQAANFLDVVPPDPDALPPAVDLELAGNCSRRPPSATVMRELEGFLSLVEQAWSRDVVLYVGDDFEDRYLVRGRLDRALWELRFLLRPDSERWLIWQLHGYANVDGIEGDVDLDVMRRPLDARPAQGGLFGSR